MIFCSFPSLLAVGFFNAPINASVNSKSLPIARVFVLYGVCVTLILFVLFGGYWTQRLG